MTVNTEKYLEFVKGVTSEPSLDYGAMGSRLAELEVTGTNTSQLPQALRDEMPLHHSQD